MTIALTLVATAAAAWTAVAAVTPQQFGKDRRRLVRALASARVKRSTARERLPSGDSRLAGEFDSGRPIRLR